MSDLHNGGKLEYDINLRATASSKRHFQTGYLIGWVLTLAGVFVSLINIVNLIQYQRCKMLMDGLPQGNDSERLYRMIQLHGGWWTREITRMGLPPQSLWFFLLAGVGLILLGVVIMKRHNRFSGELIQ